MDAERAVVDWINAADLGWKAYYDVPAKRPDAFAVVERTGGAFESLVIERPMVDVQCWAKKRRDAALMAEDVKAALIDMALNHPSFFHANITSTYRDRDMDTGTPRYHVVCELTLNE